MKNNRIIKLGQKWKYKSEWVAMEPAHCAVKQRIVTVTYIFNDDASFEVTDDVYRNRSWTLRLFLLYHDRYRHEE